MTETKKQCTKCGRALSSSGKCAICEREVDITILKQFTSKQDSLELQFAPSDNDQLILPIGSLVNKTTSQEYRLTQAASKVGRDKSNSISLPEDNYISRFHAWILIIKDTYWVEDLGSTNGTFVNNEEISNRKQIYPGDCIKFGHTELVFQLDK